jgi:hypothetical protein
MSSVGTWIAVVSLCSFSLVVPVADAIDFATIDLGVAATCAASPTVCRHHMAAAATAFATAAVLLLRAWTDVYFVTPPDVAHALIHFFSRW